MVFSSSSAESHYYFDTHFVYFETNGEFSVFFISAVGDKFNNIRLFEI